MNNYDFNESRYAPTDLATLYRLEMTEILGEAIAGIEFEAWATGAKLSSSEKAEFIAGHLDDLASDYEPKVDVALLAQIMDRVEAQLRVADITLNYKAKSQYIADHYHQEWWSKKNKKNEVKS